MIIKYKKYLSQNFLIDKNIINKIIKLINIKKNDTILEIGSGNGAITYNIKNFPKKLILIEIDKNLFLKLKKKFYKEKKIKIYNEDILKLDLKNIIKKYKKIKIFGSIPYKISTQIILKFIKIYNKISKIYLIIQKELAEKLTQKLKKYNFLSIYFKNYFKTDIIFNINKFCFYPIPKIESSFIKITPIKKIKRILNKKIFEKTIRDIYKNKKINISINVIEKYINIKIKYKNFNEKAIIRLSNFNFVSKF